MAGASGGTPAVDPPGNPRAEPASRSRPERRRPRDEPRQPAGRLPPADEEGESPPGPEPGRLDVIA